MTVPRSVIFGCRLCFLAFLLLSSMYCVFAYVPFTWHQMIQGHLISQLSWFAEVQRWLWWPVLVVAAVSAMPLWNETSSRHAVAVFFGAFGLFGAFLAFHPVLSTLENDGASLWWAWAFLLWPVWLAALEMRHSFPRLPWATRPAPCDSRVFGAAWRTALFATVVFSAIAFAADPAVSGPRVWLWTLLTHLVVFLLLFACAVAVDGFASFSFFPARTGTLLYQGLAAGLLFLFLDSRVFRAMSFQGLPAAAYGVLLAVCITAAFGSLSMALYKPDGAPVVSGLDILISPVTFLLPARKAWGMVAVMTLALCAFVFSGKLAAFDWNYVVQECSVVLVWLLAFAFFYWMSRVARTRQMRVLPLLAIAFAATGAYRYLAAGTDTSHQLQSYAGRNVSFRLAQALLTSSGSGDGGLYDFLSKRSNIARSIAVKPVDLNIVPVISEPSGPRPNIFVFVIDSLRRDYLSPYNPKVSFTPSIDRFARESAVMRNAFTRYGATGLSEPSIWVGGMMLHKQYVTPFYPMNTLSKLVNSAGYRSYVSMDTIQEAITPRTPALTELDSGVLTMNYDLCRSLTDLESKLRPDSPAFAYTQPQNIHISVIAREGKSVPAGESYPGFYAPYASRLRRIDECFGQFIGFLKDKGNYDSSVVILTADHGDSLGEDGRWGHAYTIFPEILRIPMIVHLPAALRASLKYDEETLAFSTDITPSLYYMLGQKPTINSALFGRPLFTANLSEQAAYERPEYLVASSYAAVYGLLTRQGRELYIADAVNEREYMYDVPSASAIDLNPADRAAYHQKLRALIDEIDDLYKFRPVE
jgi:arylsulfatase A-like enzyme